ncbi:antibiotic biosynthesis monooxygenase family protein [Billgrantia sp. LNSP4103-1]
MFIAMNRFRVDPERVEEFVPIRPKREIHLQGLPGFVGMEA